MTKVHARESPLVENDNQAALDYLMLLISVLREHEKKLRELIDEASRVIRER